jgi:hypothetical protein
LFVTSYVDQNPIAAIIGIVTVTPRSESGDYFCRFEYSVENRTYLPLSDEILRLFNWKAKKKEKKPIKQEVISFTNC